MSAANTDKLMTMVAKFRDGEFLFKNHSDLRNTIDASDLGDVPWQRSSFRYDDKLPDGQVPGWMTELYEVYYRDPRDVVKNIIADTTSKHAFDYVPYQEFDEDGDRRYENLMSGDWAYRQAVCFVLYIHQSADPVALTEHHRRR
jgi:Plavaka transposase